MRLHSRGRGGKYTRSEAKNELGRSSHRDSWCGFCRIRFYRHQARLDKIISDEKMVPIVGATEVTYAADAVYLVQVVRGGKHLSPG